MDNAAIVTQWVAEDRTTLDQWIRMASEAFWADTSVRVPRSKSERQNGLSLWLEHCRLKLGVVLQDEFERHFPSLAQKLSASAILDIFNDHVWPKVMPEVQRYALRGLASAWVTENMGDATTLGQPNLDGELWHIPLGIRGIGDHLGRIVLTLNGDIVPHLTTSRKQLLEAARGSTLSTPAAAAR